MIMAEIEFAGMTFKGGKMMVVLTALSTLGGALWGGFEFYKDYMDMKEIVQNIDVGAIEARNNEIEIKLEEAIAYTRDIKTSLRDDINRIERVTDATSTRVKDIQDDIDDRLREISRITRETETNLYNSMRATQLSLEAEMEMLEEDVEEMVQKALDNPLSDS
jgi:chromosome segregation ATPase